jgi:hypothetical protein
MTLSEKAKLRRTSVRRIPFEPGIDEIGPCIGICPYHWHKRIVGNGLLKECLEKKCYYLSVFRPEGGDIKEGVLLQVFIVPDKKVYKTEEQRRRAEGWLQFAGEYLREAIENYTQLALKRNDMFYTTRTEKIYPKEHPHLKGCPLEDYPKERKKKKERGGRKKKL